MCGIFGATRSLEASEVDRVLTLLDHRGPDSRGDECIGCGDGQVHFVHTRLAIQDLSTSGHQPMRSRDGRWWVTFNGEIYNHFELRRLTGGDFRGTSDTETLVEFIAASGIDDTVQKLNGIFAFAAYDTETGNLYLVRDQFGIKPLYYMEHSGVKGSSAARVRTLLFSSEIKPLLDFLPDREVDARGLQTFLSLRYIPSPGTLLRGVSRLPPGHYLVHDTRSGQSVTHRYIRPVAERFEGTFDEATEIYRQELKRAVESQLLSDVPVGVLLSGGIDSALVAAMASEKNPGLTSFTVGFGAGYEDCEIEDAAETARVLGISHEYVQVTPRDLQGSLSEIFQAIEEPLGTTSVMPMWFLSRLARSRSTVVLTGQGNDEPWGGYRRYQIEMLLTKFPWLKSPIFRIPESVSGLVPDDGFRRGLDCLGEPDTALRFSNAYALFSRSEVQALTPDSRERFSGESIRYWLQWLNDVNCSGDDEIMMRIDTRMNLADDLLLYGDKISMAFALEARVPMLDTGLIRFIESLPLSYRTGFSRTKLVHKAMASQYLPDAIVHRRKKGFQVPFGEWSRGIWKDFTGGQLLDGNRKFHRIVDRSAVERMWNRHLDGRKDFSRQIFALLMLSGWSENFL